MTPTPANAPSDGPSRKAHDTCPVASIGGWHIVKQDQHEAVHFDQTVDHRPVGQVAESRQGPPFTLVLVLAYEALPVM